MQLNILDRYEGNEERWQTIGLVNGILLLLVAHTMREAFSDEIVRIISARKATKSETKKYEQSI